MTNEWTGRGRPTKRWRWLDAALGLRGKMTGPPPSLTESDFAAFRRAWRPSRPAEPQEFSEDFLVKFQEIFAEFSDGGSWLRGCDLRRFASRIGLELTSDEVGL